MMLKKRTDLELVTGLFSYEVIMNKVVCIKDIKTTLEEGQ